MISNYKWNKSFKNGLIWFSCFYTIKVVYICWLRLTLENSHKKTFQIGEIEELKISVEMEENFERKVKPVNDEGLEEV